MPDLPDIAAASNADLPTLRIGYLALSDCAPLLAARAWGLDHAQGIHLQLSRENSWAVIRDKLVQGSLDAAQCLYGLVYGVHLGIGGPRHPMHVLMGLSSNGQAISVSRHLQAEGLASGPALAAAVQAGRRLTFAHTWPTGTHAMWLYYWLASHGIDPLRDVRVLTVPPRQMVARLGDGSIDGCCVGEPWGAQAVASGVGVTVATSQQIWPDHPEKVLASSARLASERPEQAAALVRAVLAACRRLDEPGQRRAAAALLARPEVVDVPIHVLAPRFVGDYDDGRGQCWHDTHAVRFHGAGAVNWPAPSDGVWFLTQHRRWGLLTEAPDYAAVAAAVQCTTLYAKAAGDLGVPVPETRPTVRLCDGRVWTGADPAAYAASFALPA